MHPDKFLKRAKLLQKPQMSDAEREEKLSALSGDIAGKRKEAIDARSASGIEKVWEPCEEAYLGIDDSNRHEFSGAQWAKPSSMAGPLTREISRQDNTKSTIYPRLTSRYVDSAAAKLCEILLPVDDKAFSLEPTPDPELVKHMENPEPLVDTSTGAPIMQAGTQAPPNGQPPAAPAAMPQGPAPSGAPGGAAPMTKADAANALMDQATEAAKAAEKRIYDWMIESNYPGEVRKVVHDAARIGVGVLKGPFPERRESRAMVKSPNGVALEIVSEIVPALAWIDPWNLFPHEACGEDIHDGDHIFERAFISSKVLKKLKEQEGYLGTQIDAVLEEGPGKCYVEGKNHEQLTRKRYEIWYYYGTVKREMLEIADAVGLDDIPEDQKEINVIVSMVNDRVIRAVINPLDSGSFPYRVMTWSRRPGHWAGVGVAEQISAPQRMVTAATRALSNNAGLTAGPQVVIDQTGIIPADGSWVLTPGKIWYKTADSAIADVNHAFLSVEIQSAAPQLMGYIEYAMKLAEESCGIPLITQGQTGPTSPNTFGQAELQDNNAHTWLRSIGYRFDDMMTEPLVRDLYEYLLLDPNVPDEEKGDFKINAKGSIAMVERAIQESTYPQILQAGANPAFKVDPVATFAEWLKSKRIDPRNIQYSEEKQKEMDAQPPTPPLPIILEQIKGKNALNVVQAKAQADLQESQQELAHEQQMLQNGGTTPHMASAISRIEQEKIRAATSQAVEASRASAEAARAQKEYEIAQQNGQFKIQEMQLQKELALLQYANEQKLSLDQVKSQLAKSSMDNQTKRELAAAEIQLAASEGHQDRLVDVHKHNTSLIRDEISTPDTP